MLKNLISRCFTYPKIKLIPAVLEYEVLIIGHNLYSEVIEFLFDFETDIKKNNLLYAHTLEELEKLCVEINAISELEKQTIYKIHLFNSNYYDTSALKQNSLKNTVCFSDQTTLLSKLKKFGSAYFFFLKLLSLFESDLISESICVNSLNKLIFSLLKFESELSFVFTLSLPTLLNNNFQDKLLQLAKLCNTLPEFQELFRKLYCRNYSLNNLTDTPISKKLIRLYDIIKKELSSSTEKYVPKNILVETSAEQLKPTRDFSKYFQEFPLPPTLYFVECSHFFQKYLGEGEKAVTEFFNLRKNSTYNILWIQNIELIGDKNLTCQFAQSLLTTMQIELDGISQISSKNSLVIATTNNPVSKLHYSLTRPGRFDIWLNDRNLC